MNKLWAVVLGVVVSNGAAAAVLLLTEWIIRNVHPESGGQVAFVLSEFVLLPIAIGVVNTWYWRGHTVRWGPSLLLALVNLAAGLFVSGLFMGEGVICLVIVSPLVLIFLVIGIAVGKALFTRHNTTLNVGLAAAVLALIMADALTAAPFDAKVTDTVVIHAGPEQVWPYIAGFPAIEEKPRFWMFRLGLPYPTQSTADGAYVGADRKCLFSGNLAFDEKITELVPKRLLTFDIVHQPEHPELLGHIDVQRGQFVLHDNGDGTTTLEGSSWYRLYVRPSAYFRWWSDTVVRQVHLRVMEHIRRLSEAQA
jgi:hypothetical protein